MIAESAGWRIIARATPALRHIEGRVLLAVHLAAVETGADQPIMVLAELIEGAGASRRMVHYALHSLRDRGLLDSQRVRIGQHTRPRRYRINWTRLAEHAR